MLPGNPSRGTQTVCCLVQWILYPCTVNWLSVFKGRVLTEVKWGHTLHTFSAWKHTHPVESPASPPNFSYCKISRKLPVIVAWNLRWEFIFQRVRFQMILVPLQHYQIEMFSMKTYLSMKAFGTVITYGYSWSPEDDFYCLWWPTNPLIFIFRLKTYTWAECNEI